MRPNSPTDEILRKPLAMDVAPPELSGYGPVQKPFHMTKQLEQWFIDEIEAAEKAGDPEMLALARSNLAVFREVSAILDAELIYR